MHQSHSDHEKLVHTLYDDTLRAEYAKPYDNYKVGAVPRFFGWLLVTSGNLVYGNVPSYGKFKAVEIIARIPYQSWESAAFTMLSAFFGNEERAINLCKISAFSRFAHDNETMHVIVTAHLTKGMRGIGFFRHSLIPLLFAFFYFWTSYILFLFSQKSALELNYLFESHAYQQYSEFLEKNEEELKSKLIMSEFLDFYGRHVHNEYEFFQSLRNDELIHRNLSIREIELCEGTCEV